MDEIRRWKTMPEMKLGLVLTPEDGTRKGSLGRCDVGRLARCGWIRAAGSGEKCGGGGDEGEFHEFSELVF